MIHHEVTMFAVLAAVAFAVAAGVCAVPGWLLDRSSGSRRQAWRLASSLCLVVVWTAVGIVNRGDTFAAVCAVLLIAAQLGSTRAHWRSLERARAVERLQRLVDDFAAELGAARRARMAEVAIARATGRKWIAGGRS